MHLKCWHWSEVRAESVLQHLYSLPAACTAGPQHRGFSSLLLRLLLLGGMRSIAGNPTKACVLTFLDQLDCTTDAMHPGVRSWGCAVCSWGPSIC